MTQFAWPSSSGWMPRRFRLFVIPNERVFRGYYSGQTQSLDMLGERWGAELELTETNDSAIGAARQAYFDRLRGRVNQILLPNLQASVPRGTMRGSPTLQASAAQLASTIVIQTTAGATLLAGDLIGINGQVSRIMFDATADGLGLLSVEILPRMRLATSAGAAITWNAPTIPMILTSGGGVPIDWTPGIAGGVALQLEEA